MQETVDTFCQYKEVEQQLADNKEMLEDGGLDHEMEELVKADIADLEGQKEALNSRLQILLLPKDPNDDKNVLLEVRGGTGGDEAALFAGDLMRMYTRYAAI